jgi:hypothetical protein
MSWPMLLACCVALALFMTVLPLAIFLFVVFIVVRMLYNGFDQRAKRGKATAYRSVDDPAEASAEASTDAPINKSADKPGE